MEKEIAVLRKVLDGIRDRSDHLDRENVELRARVEAEKQRSLEVRLFCFRLAWG